MKATFTNPLERGFNLIKNKPYEFIEKSNSYIIITNELGNSAMYHKKHFSFVEEVEVPKPKPKVKSKKDQILESIKSIKDIFDIFNINVINDLEDGSPYHISIFDPLEEEWKTLEGLTCNGSDLSCGIFELVDIVSRRYSLMQQINIRPEWELLKVCICKVSTIQEFSDTLIIKQIQKLKVEDKGAFYIANLINDEDSLVAKFEQLADTTSDWSTNTNDSDENDNKIFIFNIEN